MSVLAMIGMVLAIAGYYLFLLPPATKLATDMASADTVAAAMLVYQKAAVDWCLRTSCPDGPVPPQSLILPPGYRMAGWLAATAQGGRIATYEAGLGINPRSIAASLGNLTIGGPSAGLTAVAVDGGRYVVATDLAMPQRTPVVVNDSVPVNAPVVVEKIK